MKEASKHYGCVVTVTVKAINLSAVNCEKKEAACR